MSVDHAPARTSIGIAAVAAGIASLTAGTVFGVVIGGVGTVILLVGAVGGGRWAVTAGAFALLVGVGVSGASGAPVEALLVATAAAVVAWDAGEHAINVGEQLGRAARTRRGELVHAASTTLVAAASVGVSYGIYRVATGGQPVTAVVVLLIGAVVILASLRT